MPERYSPFERHSSNSRMAVVAAQQEARRLAHTYVGTEHFLLALTNPTGYGTSAEIREPTSAALASAGVSYEDAISIAKASGDDTTEDVPSERDRPRRYREKAGFLFTDPLECNEPLSEELLKALYSATTSDRLVAPHHVLIAILEEPETAAVSLLRELDVPIADVSRRLSQLSFSDHQLQSHV
jgi:ATP-dependent Clp protease ATP-binding subunit ClpA